MIKYVLQRLLGIIPTWILIGLMAFAVVHSTPGDPAAVMLGQEGATGGGIEEMRHQLGLDRPITVQLGRWLAGIFKGDLGYSFFLGRPVTQALLERLPITASLSLCAIIVAIAIGIPLGMLASLHANTFIDTGAMAIALLGLSSPEFLTGLVLIFLFAVGLNWLPVGGYMSFTHHFSLALKHMFMPAFTLGFIQAALLARITRASMLDILNSELVRTARSKGLNEGMVIWKHAFRNALLPIVTIIGMSFAMLLAGAFITEVVFVLPGMGNLIISAVKQRDYPIIQGGVLFIGSIVLLMNLLVDLLYAYIDPRITYE